MNSLRQLLDDQHGQYGKELADELKHESSKLYMPVCMLLNRVSALLAYHVQAVRKHEDARSVEALEGSVVGEEAKSEESLEPADAVSS